MFAWLWQRSLHETDRINRVDFEETTLACRMMKKINRTKQKIEKNQMKYYIYVPMSH